MTRLSYAASFYYLHKKGLVGLALLLTLTANSHAETPNKSTYVPALSFTVIGGDAGIPFSEALTQLASNGTIKMRGERFAVNEVPAELVRRAYGLPKWVGLEGLMSFLCDYNRQACAKDGGKETWKVWAQKDLARPASLDCAMPPPRTASPTFLCIPDIMTVVGKTLQPATLDSRAAAELPTTVTIYTQGCQKFDFACQRDILWQNLNQSKAWKLAGGTSLSALNDQPGGETPKWAKALSGPVNLPAALITVIVRPAVQVNAKDESREESLHKRDKECYNVEQAVKTADLITKQKRGVREEFSNIVWTDCTTVITSARIGGGKPEASPVPVSVDLQTAKQLSSQWLESVSWPSSQSKDGKGTLVGVWDGAIAPIQELNRPNTPKFNLNSPEKLGNNVLQDNSAVVWVDPFPPNPNLGPPPAGPCGSINDDNLPATTHATVIASILNDTIPGARLWSHIWDNRRIDHGPPYSPKDSLDWFNQYVTEAPQFPPIRLANLSCGTEFEDVKDESNESDALERDLVGTGRTISPYLVAVAGPNRRLPNDPKEVDWNGSPEEAPKGAAGFTKLARLTPTRGFISVVGLSPDGQDILRCESIEALLSELQSRSPDASSTAPDSICLTNADKEPLVVFGNAFDVGAPGVGVGIPALNQGPFVLWGSSLAAPYVTALATEIVGKLSTWGYPVAANLIADRIRFTTDPLPQTLIRYGRINAKLALDFDHDVFDLEASNGDVDFPELDKANECLKNGSLRLSTRSPEYRIWTSDDKSILQSEILRIRQANNKNVAVLQVIYRHSDTDPLEMAEVSMQRNASLAVECKRKGKSKPDRQFSLGLRYINSFTRCSFVLCQ